jgi:hypothetical protein
MPPVYVPGLNTNDTEHNVPPEPAAQPAEPGTSATSTLVAAEHPLQAAVAEIAIVADWVAGEIYRGP